MFYRLCCSGLLHYYYYFIINYCFMKMNMEDGDDACFFFLSVFCFLASWHFEYQQAVHGSFLVFFRLLAFGAWCLVLGLGAFIGSFFFFFFFFFAGDKYLRHSALDSNCIYSFGFYFLPALQSKSFFTQELLEKYIQVYMCPAYE